MIRLILLLSINLTLAALLWVKDDMIDLVVLLLLLLLLLL
jgi:hypothetical protein